MKFLKQVKFEIINILRSRFLVVLGIIVLFISIAAPVINVISRTENNGNGGYYPRPIMYAERAYAYDMKGGYYPGGYGYDEPITVDGYTIEPKNPSYYNIKYALNMQKDIQDGNLPFENPESADLAYDFVGLQIEYYMHYAKAIPENYSDYRFEVQQSGLDSLIDKFIYERSDKDPAVLFEAYRMFAPMRYYEFEQTNDDPAFAEFNAKYINITPEERLEALSKAEEKISKIYDLIDNDNLSVYIEIMMQQSQGEVERLESQIEERKQEAVNNPDPNMDYNQLIKDLENQRDFILEYTIPTLEYRLNKNIRPNENVWQNTALYDIQDSRSQLQWLTIITEEEFNNYENGYKQQYGTYENYVAAQTKQINDLNNKILIAQNSLDDDKPDMKYVPDGARYITMQFLDYSIMVALLAILVGSWIMGSEFQQGTIRLLLIRPKTRTKIMMAKFLAALILCLAVYFLGSILNLLTNGICFGFSDFGFPNYTVTGPVGFFGPYILALLACSVTIIFAFSVAFMLSMLIKIIAVSIAVPVVCYIGCTLALAWLAFSRMVNWIAYTPIPYVQLPSFFKPQAMYSMDPISYLIQRGMPLSVEYGIMMLLVLSGICIAVSILTFRKKDITN